MNQKEGFVSGALILLVSGIIVKILGALFKIPLTNIIGDSGMGLFSFAMQFFSLLFVVAAAGLPVAESHLVSDALARGKRGYAQAIVTQAIVVFGGTAVMLAVLLAVFAPNLCRLFGEQLDAAWCLLAIAPAIVLVTIEAALRGWYQGTGNMVPTAASQVAEAIGKLVMGLWLAQACLRAGYGISGAAAGAVLGVTCGELCSVSYLLWSARHGIRSALHDREKAPSALPQLIQLMIPVTLCSAVMTVSGFLDMAVIYRRLPDAGFTSKEIVAAYGAYTGMALTLFNLPLALSNAISISVLPALSAAHAQHNTAKIRRFILSSLRMTLLVCLPCGAGLLVFADPLLHALFASQPRGVQTAIPLLQILAIAEPLVGMASVSTSVLQSFGRPDLALYSMTAACILKFSVSFSLAGMPNYHICAAPIGSLVCYSVLFLCNIIQIIRLVGWVPPLTKAIVRPLAASICMAALCSVLYTELHLRMGLYPAIILTVGGAIPLYIILLGIFRALEPEDILPLPGGNQLAHLLRLTPK